MKGAIKIVTIGGGSSYTPELMEGFIKRYEDLPIKEIWLVDIEDGKEKVEIVGALAQRMWDASPYDVKVYTTLDRREALKDADFVTTQFRVGLLAVSYTHLIGTEDELTAEEIKEADVVILAVDIAITGTERFEGKPTIKVPTNVCVKAPKKLIEKIENELGK